MGTLSALLSGLSALLLAEAVSAVAAGSSKFLPYAVGAGLAKYCATVVLSRILLRVGNLERNRSRERLFPLLSEGLRSRGQVGDLLTSADQSGLVATVQSSYASLRLAPLSLLVVFLAGGWLSVGIAATLIAVSIPLYIRAGQNAEKFGDEYETALADLELRELQVLEAGQELRGLGAGSFACDEVAALSEREHSSAMKALRAALQSSLITEFLSGVGIGLVAMVAGFALLGMRTTLLRGLIAVLFTNELFASVRRFGSEFHQSQESEQALKTFSTKRESLKSEVSLPRAIGLVASKGKTPVDLNLRTGSRLLITGPSGSGKSSLLEALLGLRNPLEGTVESGSSAIAYVTPNERLYSGTLRENLDPSGQHGDLTLSEALAGVGLPAGRFGSLDARLGPNGEGLSSGELVRFLLARGIVAQASLFVLDDISGLLDPASRKTVEKYFNSNPHLCVVEAAIDSPLLSATSTIKVTP